jgi:hypothetical protein
MPKKKFRKGTQSYRMPITGEHVAAPTLDQPDFGRHDEVFERMYGRVKKAAPIRPLGKEF